MMKGECAMLWAAAIVTTYLAGIYFIRLVWWQE